MTPDDRIAELETLVAQQQALIAQLRKRRRPLLQALQAIFTGRPLLPAVV